MQLRAMSEVKPRDILNGGPTQLREKTRRDGAVALLLEKHHFFEAKQPGGTVLRLHPKLAGGVHVKS